MCEEFIRTGVGERIREEMRGGLIVNNFRDLIAMVGKKGSTIRNYMRENEEKLGLCKEGKLINCESGEFDER